MTLLRSAAAPAKPLLTRVPLATDPLPPIPEPMEPWPGRQVDLPGLRLHIRETPGPADAPTTVYVHGLGGSATNWTELSGQLSGRSAGIAVDLPGFGRSAPPERGTLPSGRPVLFGLTDFADVVVSAIAEFGNGPVHLVGNSMGGAIALLVAAARPELVRTLTLVSPAMPDLRPNPRRLSDPRIAVAVIPVLGRRMRRALSQVTPAEQADQLLRLCFAEPARVSPGRVALAVGEYEERLAMPWAGRSLSDATNALFRAWLTGGDRSLWAVAARVAAPTLVVWGDRDKLVTVRKAPRTAQVLPRGRLLVLPRTGHVAQMERPVSVARAVLGMWDAVAADEW
ncbi:MAG TPA: alpha/beta fold hydrolase [Pseudonocardiaceae bacterium]|jgi:pimeloyl-ACP methyl ester carboxylesterase|nr:alpha/beta fold hydrolase [Pseudonocardiaceae bacterium]